MMKKFLYLIAVLTIISCNNPDKTSIVQEYEIIIEPNYYVSLNWWGLKQLGFLGNDANPEYLNWTNKLSEAGEDIQFKAPVAGGPLFIFIFQIPGYIGPENVDDFEKIIEGCIRFIQTGSIEKLKADWPKETKYLEKWYNPVYIDVILSEIGANKEDVIKTLEIWKDYIKVIWDQYLPIYNNKIEEYPFDSINALYKTSTILHQWDSVMGIQYPYEKFIVCICPENNTLASSLGPEKIVFGARYSKDYLEHSIVHESGVRYFPFDEFASRDESAKIMKTDYENLLRIIETEVCFRKPEILKIDKDVFLYGMHLEEILKFRQQKSQNNQDIFDFITQLYLEAKKDSIIK